MVLIVFLILLAILVSVEMVIYRKHAMDNLTLDVHFSSPIAGYGDTIEVIEEAQNNKRLPLPFLLLKFEAPSSFHFLDMTNTSASDLLYREDMLTMKPFSRHTRKIKATCNRRGYFSFVRITISTSDLLLINKIAKDCPNDSAIAVLPRILSAEEMQMLMSVTFSDFIQRRTLLTDPFAFSGIREYQPWDPMKSINWTATARAGDFMVNQQTSTSTRQVTILLNLAYYDRNHSDDLLELSISLVYSFMLAFNRAGIPCAFHTNGRDVLTELPVSLNMSASPLELEHRGEALAKIDLSQEVMPFADLLEDQNMFSYSDDYTLVISPCSDGLFRKAMLQLKSHRSTLRWISPCYRGSNEIKIEPELREHFTRWEVTARD